MRASLAALARESRCARPSALSCRRLSANTDAWSSSPSFVDPAPMAARIKNPAAALGRCGVCWCLDSLCLSSGVREGPAPCAPKEERYEAKYERTTTGRDAEASAIEAGGYCSDGHVAEQPKRVWADVSTPSRGLSTKQVRARVRIHISFRGLRNPRPQPNVATGKRSGKLPALAPFRKRAAAVARASSRTPSRNGSGRRASRPSGTGCSSCRASGGCRGRRDRRPRRARQAR